jgi:hypothetical protein
MKVEAIKRGIYGGILREPGSRFARFVLTDTKHFSRHWMRKLEDDSPVEPPPAKPPQTSAPKSFVELMNEPTSAMVAEKAERESPQSQIQERPKTKGAAKSTGDQQVI